MVNFFNWRWINWANKRIIFIFGTVCWHNHFYYSNGQTCAHCVSNCDCQQSHDNGDNALRYRAWEKQCQICSVFIANKMFYYTVLSGFCTQKHRFILKILVNHLHFVLFALSMLVDSSFMWQNKRSKSKIVGSFCYLIIGTTEIIILGRCIQCQWLSEEDTASKQSIWAISCVLHKM